MSLSGNKHEHAAFIWDNLAGCALERGRERETGDLDG